VKVKDPNGQPVPVDVRDNGDGTYGIVYHPDVDGPHTIEASLDDIPIRDMPKIGTLQWRESFLLFFLLLHFCIFVS
jgi:hypothetical protein